MNGHLSDAPSPKIGPLNPGYGMNRTSRRFLLLGSALFASAVCAVADEFTQPVSMPPVTVTATNEIAEEAPLGPNKQPEWTARRRFTTTRIYVQPPWQFEAESGWDAQYFRSGHGSPFHLLTQEFELGLPHRFQVDYEYAETINKGGDGRWRYDSSSFELRWALAEWGKIPLNPTIKAEWKINNADADAYELNLALGDQIAPRWHWGSNLFYEQQVGTDRERELDATLAISYSLIDEKLGIGTEMKLTDETDKDDRVSHLQFQIGPSLQWRPTPRTHLDLVPLLGTTGPSPRVEAFLFFGIDFGPGSEHEGVEPASLRNK
jgi:hypothetical protein